MKLETADIAIIAYFVLACALSWLFWIPMIIDGDLVVPGALPSHMPGLLGPAVAAVLAACIFGGRVSVADLLRRVVRVRFPLVGWIAALSPIAFLLAGLVGEAIIEGSWPDLAGLGRFSGVPEIGLPAVLAIVFVANALGEEIGWRGYALPRLQDRLGPLRGTVVLYAMWAFWHIPLFWLVANFMDMSAFMVAGWIVGLLAGSLVLANVTHLARGSVLAAAIWHLTYNVASGTDLGSVAPMVATFFVVFWAVSLVRHDVGRKGASLLEVPPPPDPRPRR